jgi:hypothetical protein
MRRMLVFIYCNCMIPKFIHHETSMTAVHAKETRASWRPVLMSGICNGRKLDTDTGLSFEFPDRRPDWIPPPLAEGFVPIPTHLFSCYIIQYSPNEKSNENVTCIDTAVKK